MPTLQYSQTLNLEKKQSENKDLTKTEYIASQELYCVVPDHKLHRKIIRPIHFFVT